MTIRAHSISRAATATAAIASAFAYPLLPERVATRFDTDGQPNRFSSRLSAAVMLPATMVGLSFLNDRIGGWPGGGDRENSLSGAEARDAAIGLVDLALLLTQLAVLARGLGLPIDMRRVERSVYGVLLIGLGNVLPKLPRNGLIGIRTPWTLADPTVWERTHRIGGYLLAAAGLVSLASLPATSKRASRLPLASTLGAVGFTTAYSFVVYVRRTHSGRQ